jgi:porin
MSRWISRLAPVCLVALILYSTAMADDATDPTEGGTATSPATSPSTKPASLPASQPSDWFDMGRDMTHPHEMPTTASPRMVPWVDYTGDLWQRAALTGDWFGIRQQMMDKGLRVNVNLTQAIQGNIGGGASKRAWYQGGLRYEIDLDTGAAGLWPGGVFHVRAETPYGKNDNADSDALYPVPNQSETCLSEAYYMQFVAPWLGFLAGKMSPRDNNAFAHDETTQFMNTAFNFNPVIGMTVPLDFMGAGVILKPTEWFTITTLVLDSEGTSSVSGFDTTFDRGTTIYQMSEFAIKPFGQQGHQRLAWTWSDESSIAFEQNSRGLIADYIKYKLGHGPQPTLAREGSDWCMMYDFDQYLYTRPGTKDQGFGLFGRFGFSDGTVNPVGQFYSMGLGGKGMIPSRDNDTFGAGYYYLAVSDKLGPVISRFLNDEQGVELYYNIQVTPWLHITPDLQVINPGKTAQDQAVVAGIRMRIDF